MAFGSANNFLKWTLPSPQRCSWRSIEGWSAENRPTPKLVAPAKLQPSWQNGGHGGLGKWRCWRIRLWPTHPSILTSPSIILFEMYISLGIIPNASFQFLITSF